MLDAVLTLLHATAAALAVGHVASAAVVSGTLRGAPPSSRDWTAIRRLAALGTINLALLLVTGVCLNLTHGGPYGATTWFRASLVITAACVFVQWQSWKLARAAELASESGFASASILERIRLLSIAVVAGGLFVAMLMVIPHLLSQGRLSSQRSQHHPGSGRVRPADITQTLGASAPTTRTTESDARKKSATTYPRRFIWQRIGDVLGASNLSAGLGLKSNPDADGAVF